MLRFARYVAVQAATYGLDMGLFLLLFVLARQDAVLANVAAKVFAGIFAFLAHRYFTFEAAREGKQTRQAVLYVVLWSLNVPLSTGLLAFFLLLGMPAVVAKIIADVVCVGFNYWVSCNYIFTGLRESTAGAGPVCPACGDAMHAEETWVFRCPACAFMASALPPGAGRGVAGLGSLRTRNFETILDRLEKLVPGRGASLLEVGCASGRFLERAARRGMRVEGIEPEPGVERACSVAGVNVRAGYFPDALDEDSHYQVIVFNDVFEHLPDPGRAIAEVERRLEPAGLAVLNLPSTDGPMFRAARLLNGLGLTGPYERLWQKGMESPHVTYFNPLNLRSLVERHTGLRLVHVSRLSALSRKGLWPRIASTWSPAASAVLFPVAWCASFVLNWFPSDIVLTIFRKEAAPGV